MNIVLAIGCAILFENWVIQGLMKNKNIFEITGVIGGNITFFATIQNYFAKMLLSICHRCKLNEEARSRRNSQDLNDPESISQESLLYDNERCSLPPLSPISSAKILSRDVISESPPPIHSPQRRGRQQFKSVEMQSNILTTHK